MCRSAFRLPAAFALPVIFPFFLFSQEQTGMRLERYAGIYSAAINPAYTAFSPNTWDLSLFSADVFADNNYAFLQKTSIQHALQNTEEIVSVPDLLGEIPPPRTAIFLNYFDKRRKLHALLQARVAGPSFSVRFREKNVFGLTTALRTQVSSYGLPEILRYNNISDLPRNQVIDIPPAGLAGMAWGEIGAHYSRRNTDRDLYTAFGISPKLLLGLEGFFSRARSNFDYSQRLNDTVAFAGARWDYGLTTSNLNDDGNIRAKVNGTGFGLDLGFTWVKPAENVDMEEDYAWRFGASLLDLGFVRFRRNAERHRIVFDTTIAISPADFPPRSDPHDLLGDVSKAFLSDPQASLQARSFLIGLPAALSLQFDARLAPHVYASGVWVQGLALLRPTLRRSSTLALVPRLEHRWWSASLPLVLSDWQSFRMGFAARLGVLYLGTDNLSSFFQKAKLTGSDFYIGLKINAFALHFGEWKKKPARGDGKKSKRKIKCYTF